MIEYVYRLTDIYKFRPVIVIHMIVQCFCPICSRGGSGGVGATIQAGPQ